MNTNNTPHTVGHVGWSPDYKSTPMPPVTGKLIARRSAAACSPRVLAEMIAKRLFTDGSGTEATRLELKVKNPITISTHPEMALGGWCFKAAVDQIAKVIEENADVEARRK